MDVVYFLEMPEMHLVKIGYTGDFKKRKKDIDRNMHGKTTKVLAVIENGSKKLEELIHNHLEKNRFFYEWFKPDDYFNKIVWLANNDTEKLFRIVNYVSTNKNKYMNGRQVDIFTFMGVCKLFYEITNNKQLIEIVINKLITHLDDSKKSNLFEMIIKH